MASNNSNGSSNSSNKKNFDGQKAVAEMLSIMDKTGREKLLANLERHSPGIVKDIKKMFVFEDLLQLEESKIQFILKSIPPDKLRIALRTASKELVDKILSSMTSRAAELLKEELVQQGPQRQSAVTSAQTEIVEIASKLFNSI